MTPTRVALAALVLLFIAPPALADVPPPPGYVESCTVAKQKKAGEECVSCGAAYFREPDACKKMYAGQGYERRCRTRGASTWDEVWCRKKGAKPTPPTPPTPTKPTDDDAPPTPSTPTDGDEPPTPTDETEALDLTLTRPSLLDNPTLAPGTTDDPAPEQDEPKRPQIGDPPVAPTPPTPPSAAKDEEPTTPAKTDESEEPAPPAVHDEPPPPDKKKSSCAGGPVTTPLGVLLAMGLLLVLRRRARRA